MAAAAATWAGSSSSSSQQPHEIMTSRRVPLSALHNAANSPVRAVAAAAKRSQQSYGSQQRELVYTGAATSKKESRQEEDQSVSLPRTPMKKRDLSESAEGRVFRTRNSNAQPTAFERRLIATRDEPVQRQQQQQQQQHSAGGKTESSKENLDNIRQWQRHYQRVFPQFVFYFENIPDEARALCSEQIQVLGAKEEKFFSKAVTHVVTTRTIPPELEGPNAADAVSPSSNTTESQVASQFKTINPILLERSSDISSAQSSTVPRGAFTFELPSGKRLAHDGEARKQAGGRADVLTRARELHMKIWALEKLQRMMKTMFETDTGAQPQLGRKTRSNVGVIGGKNHKQADLSELLRNERLHGPSDRDPTVATKDLIHFKGYHLYVSDAEGKTRPIMVRDFPKVSHKQDGSWPQFRSVPGGRCPFVEDQRPSRPVREAPTKVSANQLPGGRVLEPKTRIATRAATMDPPPAVTGKRQLAEMEGSGRSTTSLPGQMSRQHSIDQSKLIATGIEEPLDSAIASKDFQTSCSTSTAPSIRFCGGEPVASGIQKSNITSAIRSQMISSTAAAPGPKTSMSKEVHELKRKVLEKNNTQPAISTSTLNSASTDRSERPAGPLRASSNNARSKLGAVQEERGAIDQEEISSKLEKRKILALEQVKRDPKPGYCENCREKFDDFDTHTLSRRHQKFALSRDNWAELDSLLGELTRRPLPQRRR